MKALISQGIVSEWKVASRKRFRVLGYYDHRSKVEEILSYFLDGDLDVCLTEAGVKYTAKDVRERIDADTKHTRTRRYGMRLP